MPYPSLGVIFHPSFPPSSLADYACKAEAGGFDELWLWDDCFQPGALTAAAIALTATRRLKVGIGLLPATAHNPLFAAMELATLARAFPGRILPGFGHGVDFWMKQIGAAPKSSLRSVEETVTCVRRILAGEVVTFHGSQVNLDRVKLHIPPEIIPPIYIGGMREKTLRLAGRAGDGSILVANSSPAYVRWALEHIRAGMAEGGRSQHQAAVYVDVKVCPDGKSAREAARLALAARLPWFDQPLKLAGLEQERAALAQAHAAGQSTEQLAGQISDAVVDALCAAGTPAEVAAYLHELAEAGAGSLIFQPLEGDPDCLDEYIAHVIPMLK